MVQLKQKKKLIDTDTRVKFYQQKSSISPGENFEFVLNKSSGKYFKWNSHDDFISKDFISKNVEFLEKKTMTLHLALRHVALIMN